MADKLDLVVDRLNDVKESVNDIQKDIHHIKVDIIRNTDNLSVHMKRTDLNETRLKMLEEKLSITYLLKLSLATAAGIGTITGAVWGAIRLLEYFTR
jgi:hypothetical protein